jgi:hypothetical protein
MQFSCFEWSFTYFKHKAIDIKESLLYKGCKWNLSVGLVHSFLAYKAILQGIQKLQVGCFNAESMRKVILLALSTAYKYVCPNEVYQIINTEVWIQKELPLDTQKTIY